MFYVGYVRVCIGHIVHGRFNRLGCAANIREYAI